MSFNKLYKILHNLCRHEVIFDVLAKLVSVTVITSIELPHSEWILLSLQFIANAYELLSMLSFKNKFLLQLFILYKLAIQLKQQLTIRIQQ